MLLTVDVNGSNDSGIRRPGRPPVNKTGIFLLLCCFSFFGVCFNYLIPVLNTYTDERPEMPQNGIPDFISCVKI